MRIAEVTYIWPSSIDTCPIAYTDDEELDTIVENALSDCNEYSRTHNGETFTIIVIVEE